MKWLKNDNFKGNVLPHLIIIGGFVLITALFFSPAFFGGKELRQGDILAHKGASKEIVDHRESTGEEPLWTNSMFGGMPAYQISTEHNTNFLKQIVNSTRVLLPHPFNHLFIAFLCFYGLMLILKINPLLGAAGAIAFGLSSYNIQLYEAGHNSKIEAISLMPMVLGAVVLIFRKKWLLGGLLFAVFLSLELAANHVQITYYLGLLIGFVVLSYFIHFLVKKEYLTVGKAAITLLVGMILSLATNASLLWTTYSYKDQTIRGKSELQAKEGQENSTSGLDKSYITQWSYGKAETFSLLVPNFKGGSSGQLKSEKAAIKEVDRKHRKAVEGMDRYFGGQPFTSGPVYFGACICFLFVLGLVLYRGKLLIPLVLAAVLSVLLSWGKNLMWFSDLFIDHMPLYNNFRAVSMTLVIAGLAFPVLAFLGLKTFLESEPETRQKSIYIAGGIVGGLLVLFILLPEQTNSFFKPADPLVESSLDEQTQLQQQLTEYNWPQKDQDGLLEGLEEARKYLFVSDAQRSLAFVVGLIVLLLIYHKGVLPQKYLGPILILFVLFDLWGIDKRYLNDENYVKKSKAEHPFESSAADQFILNSQEKGRVLNLAVNTWNDASTSFYHQSIGGYSAVKLRRYQELYDYELYQEIEQIKSAMSTGSFSSIDSVLKRSDALNMLNTRYIIYNPGAAPIVNRYHKGDAWFVSVAEEALSADEELAKTKNVLVNEVAVISSQEKGNVTANTYLKDSSQSISKTSYRPNEITYEVQSKEKALVVFSEIFYKNGWKAYIDGEEQPIARANYVLRALEVPGGKHTVKFAFEPKEYRMGSIIAATSSGLILLLLALLGFKEFKAQKRVE